MASLGHFFSMENPFYMAKSYLFSPVKETLQVVPGPCLFGHGYRTVIGEGMFTLHLSADFGVYGHEWMMVS
jgi:hypothetical protein